MGRELAAAIQRLVAIDLELAEPGDAAAVDMIAERERLRKAIGL